MKTGFSAGDYDIRLDDKFGHLALIDIDAEAVSHEPWFNQTLTSVNDSVRLSRHQSYTVPRTVMHRTSAPVRTVILMVEAAGITPTGDDPPAG